MSTVKIETLSSVHIGSGNLLQQNTDFVVESGRIGIIDDKKLLGLIGISNIDKWVQSIEKRENTKELLSRFKPMAKLPDYTKRILDCYAKNIKSSDSLKECIHDGTGKPYIPGSSIKGAIRTALLSSIVSKVGGIENNISTDGKVKSSNIEKKLFGSDPNSDLFRFIHVGDAYFSKGAEIALKMVNLNIREKQDFWDETKPQLIEAIASDEESSFQLNVKEPYYRFVKTKGAQIKTFSMPDIYDEMSCLTNLFLTINEHTRRLVKQEIEIWNNYESETNVDSYLSQLKEMEESIAECVPGKSCVLRIGHASGWRFITGAWTESLSNFKSLVVPKSRPNNYRYEDYIFPKTRRVDDECYLLGFVKLTIQ
jgi:CRISPR-associated protein Csm5